MSTPFEIKNKIRPYITSIEKHIETLDPKIAFGEYKDNTSIIIDALSFINEVYKNSKDNLLSDNIFNNIILINKMLSQLKYYDIEKYTVSILFDILNCSHNNDFKEIDIHDRASKFIKELGYTEIYAKNIKNKKNYNEIQVLKKEYAELKSIIGPLENPSKELEALLESHAVTQQQAKNTIERAQQAVKDAQKATIEVRGLANIASQSGLAKEFEKCINKLQPGRIFWLIMVIISLLSMGWILVWDLLHFPPPNAGNDIFKNWIEGIMHRLPLVIPCLFAVWLSSRRYHDTVRLIEDYRFKSRLCATYSGFLDACRRIDGCTEMATTGEGGQPAVQTRRSYDAEMELTRTVLRVISTDPTRHLRKDKEDSGPVLGLAEHCVDAIAGVVKRDKKGD